MRPRVPRAWRPADLPELFRLWLIMAFVDIRLALAPSCWNRRWIFRKRTATQGTPGRRSLQKITRIARLVRVAARFRLRRRAPCLCMSLALRHRLAACGIRADLVYGARKNERGIDAHAWLRIGDFDIDPSNSGRPSFSEFRPPDIR